MRHTAAIMRRALLALAIASCAVSLVACSKKAESPAPAGIAWVQAAGDAEVDAAFARAKAEGKPVFVYWGAKWCPPCNQLKATLFNRQDFIERSRAFVPVYVDGDQPGAQKLGTRFAVRGYPTTIVFTREGRELTRLPGEVDAAQYNEVLALALAAQRPAKELLAAARSGGQGLADADWRLLAWYSWETDQQQLVGEHGVPALLRELAKACPASSADAAMRLRLKALAAEGAKGVVADAAQARRHVDVLTGNPKEIVAALAAVDSPERAPLVSAYDAALATLQADATLSRADRLTALVARVQIGAKERLPALQAEARELAARFDREISDGYERQAVITTAAWMLEEAGALDDAKTLLEANLAKSHSPYYLMSELAANAKKRGDTAAALDWSAQAFEKSEGAATRLQWGAAYLRALVEFAPQDAARIEALAARIIDEAAAQPDAFEARSGRSMQRVGKLLRDWDPLGERAAVLQRLQQRLDAVCAKLPAGGEARGVCEAALKPGAAA